MGGFTARKDMGNSGHAGKIFEYDVAASHATALAPGDMVVITGTSTAGTGIGQVDAAAATGAFSGVIAAIDPVYEGEALSDSGLPASTAGTVRVHVDAECLFEVDVANGPLVAADVGLNANSVVTAATKTGGVTRSNMTLNATGKATTATLQWRIVRLLEDENGTLGNRAVVRPNNTTNSPNKAGV